MARLEFTLPEALELLKQNVQLPKLVDLYEDSGIIVAETSPFKVTAHITYREYSEGIIYLDIKGKSSKIVLMLLNWIRYQLPQEIVIVNSSTIGICLKTILDKQLKGLEVSQIEQNGEQFMVSVNVYNGEERHSDEKEKPISS